jgi:hypothetical protein
MLVHRPQFADLQGVAGFRHQVHAGRHFTTRCPNERVDFLCRLGGALCNFAHFLSDDGEALACLTGSRGFDACVRASSLGWNAISSMTPTMLDISLEDCSMRLMASTAWVTIWPEVAALAFASAATLRAPRRVWMTRRHWP